VMLAP